MQLKGVRGGCRCAGGCVSGGGGLVVCSQGCFRLGHHFGEGGIQLLDPGLGDPGVGGLEGLLQGLAQEGL